MINKIVNYDEIKLMPNSLIVFDIDETILKFQGINQKWWDFNYNEYYRYYEMSHARKLVLNKWFDIVSTSQPKILDEVCFNDLIKNANKLNCKIIYLTARDKEQMAEVTEKNLNSCNISFNVNDIYYSKSKGDKLLEILESIKNQMENYKTSSINDIIFIDDVLANVNDVQKKLSNRYNLHLYHIDHINLYKEN
jgi:predicted secreted acid phosphatase